MNDNKPKDYFMEALNQVPEPESFPGQYNIFAGCSRLLAKLKQLASGWRICPGSWIPEMVERQARAGDWFGC